MNAYNQMIHDKGSTHSHTHELSQQLIICICEGTKVFMSTSCLAPLLLLLCMSTAFSFFGNCCITVILQSSRNVLQNKNSNSLKLSSSCSTDKLMCNTLYLCLGQLSSFLFNTTRSPLLCRTRTCGPPQVAKSGCSSLDCSTQPENAPQTLQAINGPSFPNTTSSRCSLVAARSRLTVVIHDTLGKDCDGKY